MSYEQADPDPEAALQCFGADITSLLEDYLVHECWHELMDFMSRHTKDDGSLDWRAAELAYRKEFYELEQQHTANNRKD